MTDRRRWLLWGLLAYLAILTAVALSLLVLYRGARDRLDQALGQRLVAVATASAMLVENGDALEEWSLETEESTELIWLASRLEQIRRDNDLAEITLCDPFGLVLISASGRLEWGEQNVFWQLDPGAVELALGGFPAASRLYRHAQLVQKSAHAPIFTSGGAVSGVLTVEGNADFFDALATLRSGAILTLAVVMAFLAVMGVFLWQINRSVERYRASVLRQENLAAMGRMTAGIAHEIRNPLGIIRGAGQHLTQRLQEAGIEDDVAGFITTEVDRLDRILTGYLAFGSEVEAEAEDFDLVTVVHRSVGLLAEDMQAAGITLRVAEPLAASPLRGDPLRLRQVLLNLLLNARDAMPEGGAVEVGLVREGRDYVLTVSDEGSGLRGLDPGKVFAPFWTSKEKGSGLGLALSRQIVESFGGRLELGERVDRQGAVATLRLPVVNPD